MRCKLQLNGFLEFYFNNIIIYQLLVHYYIILQLYIKIIYYNYYDYDYKIINK